MNKKINISGLNYSWTRIVIAILVVLFIGCSETPQRPTRVPSIPIQVNYSSLFRKSVEAIMEARYTDALRIFEALEIYIENRSPREKAAYLIQRAQAEAMMFRGSDAAKHLTEADSITRRHGLDSLRCLMYNAYGILSQNSESDRFAALEYYIQGMNLAKAIDYEYMNAVLSVNAAWLFLLDRDMSGLVYAEGCYNYATRHNVPSVVYCGALTTAQFYIMQNRLVEAEELLNIAHQAALECRVADLTELYMGFGDLYAAMSNHDKAIDSYEKAISYKDVAVVDYTFFAYVHYSEYLLSLQRYRDAISYMNDGLKYVIHHHLQVERPRAYNVMASAYDKLGISDSASYYKTQAVVESDVLHRRDIVNVKRNVIAKYEKEYRLTITEMQLHSMREKMWLYITAFLILLIASIVLVISRNRKIKLYKQLVAREVEWNKERSRLEQANERSVANTVQDDNEDRRSVSDNERVLFERIDKLMRVDKLYKDPFLGRDKLAEILQTNRTYISKAINSVRGESVSRYIAIYRLEAASKMLSDIGDNTPIKDIATELGFTSLSTFYSLFKERYEMSPDKFRKYARENGGEIS